MSVAAAEKKFYSPETGGGSFVYSLLAHGLFYGLLVVALGIHISHTPPKQEYLDLGYQEFDAPPQPEQVEHKVKHSVEPVTPVKTAIPDNSPKELQDEKSDVAGRQEAAKESPALGNDAHGTAEATPYYKIKPKYPREARISGTEGWVLFEIDINEKGEVENVRTVDGVNRNMFEREARRAVEQYRYKPFTDAHGQPVKKLAHQVRVEFTLKGEEIESAGN